MKLAYTVAFHPLLCSIICLNVKIWSAHDLPLRNIACSFRRRGSTMSIILFKMTLQRTLLVMDSSFFSPPIVGVIQVTFLGQPIFHWWALSLSPRCYIGYPSILLVLSRLLLSASLLFHYLGSWCFGDLFQCWFTSAYIQDFISRAYLCFHWWVVSVEHSFKVFLPTC